MEDIVVKKLNEVHLKVLCDPGVAHEISDWFTFEVPNAKFTPAYRNKMWDGKIRLYNLLTQTLYCGLVRHLEAFAESRKYNLIFEYDRSSRNFSIKEALDFITELNPKFPPRDYQIKAFTHAVREERSLLLSPTASGKSFIIYLLARFYNKKTLIIVPTTSLVGQLISDFADYGFDSTNHMHGVFAGKDKLSPKQITVSTWQSIYKMPKEYFDNFEVIVGDEAHLFKAKSLTTIMSKLEDCKYRFGFTGTLDGTTTNKLVLEGLFGAVKKVITTSKLIEDNHLSDFKIKSIVLTYPDEVRKLMSKADYQAEMDYLVRLNERNKFIKNLVGSLNGNTLVLFQYVDKHGKVLNDEIKTAFPDKNVHFVHGGVTGDARNNIRLDVENDNNSIIIASYGTFSTGINIKNLQNIVFASPSKSRIRNLQSIGRVLRKSANSEQATLFDIADDLSWKQKKNHTIRHFMERIKIYNEEKFSYKIYNVELIIDQ